MTLRVAGLWRYPVKTLAGESIQTALLETTGIPGDRIVHVRGPEGVRTSRRQHRLIGLHGALGARRPAAGGGSPLAKRGGPRPREENCGPGCVARGLRHRRQLRGRLALNAEVIRPGTINVGDPVTLIREIDRDFV